MPTYNYLPGVIVNTLDGGLTASFAPQDDPILVIGTAGQGPVNTPYQVTDRALAAQTFGAAGTLERGIEECATYSDNILAFRIGAAPMQLTGVGLDTTVGTATPGFNITFNDVTGDAPPATSSGTRRVCSVCGKTARWNTRNDYVPSFRRNIKFPRARAKPRPRSSGPELAAFQVLYNELGRYGSAVTDGVQSAVKRLIFLSRKGLPDR